MSALNKLSLDEIRSLRNESYNVTIQYLRENDGVNGFISVPHTTDDDNTRKMRLLINQFHYGLEAKNELLELCIEMGLIKV